MAVTDFEIKFDGDSEIDVNTLITSLVGISSVVYEIQSKLKPETKVELKVKALEKGSFLVLLGIHSAELLGVMKDLFTRENITLSAAILSSLVHSINLKKHLKGEKAKSVIPSDDGQNVTIENSNGQTLVINTKVFNMYTKDSTIDQNLTKSFEAISTDENINSFKITDGNKKTLIEIPKEVFPQMTIVNDDVVSNKRVMEKNNATLNITKLSFDKGLKWSFIYEGIKISANIIDDDFYKNIDEGKQFAKGDSLIVDLKIHQEFDNSVNAYINKKYQIVKVNNHIQRAKQLDIEF